MRRPANRSRNRAIGLCFSWACCLAAASGTPAQETWEYSPYRVHVGVAVSDSLRMHGGLVDEIAARLEQRVWSVFGAAWSIRTERCPESLRLDAEQRLASIGIADLPEEMQPLVKEADKLYLLGLSDDGVSLYIAARELDCRTRGWQPVAVSAVRQPDALIDAVADAVIEAFTPVARIEDARSKEAVARLRAGGLVTREACPATVAPGSILLPIIRRNDRLGEPIENGIQPAPWTFLSVASAEGSMLNCVVHSGMRGALGGRASTRTVRLALAVRPSHESTELVVRTQDAVPQPLDGYAVYAKDPQTEDTELVGVTDWRGTIRLSRSTPALQLYYIRSGERLLARLPIVAGLEPQVVAALYDDDARLQAEGFVKGLQNQVMDLVSRRELAMMRFRRHLERKEFTEAKLLLEKFRGLQTQSDLSRLIDQQEQRLKSPDRRVQGRIDQLFRDTRQLLSRFLDPRTSNQLQQELLQAQQSG